MNDFLRNIFQEYVSKVSNNDLINMLTARMHEASIKYVEDSEIITLIFGFINFLHLDFISLSPQENEKSIIAAQACFDNINDNSKKLRPFKELGLGLIEMKKAKLCKGEEIIHHYIEARKFFISSLKEEEIVLSIYQLGNSYYKEAKKVQNLDKVNELCAEANRHFLRALHLTGNNYPRALNKLGDSYLKQKNFLEADEVYLRASEISPNFAYPYNGRGNCFREQGRYYEAINEYIRAIEHSEGRLGYAYNYLGDCYRILGEFQLAILNYERAREIIKNSPFPLNGLGCAYYGLGKISDTTSNYQKAINFFNEAIALKTDFYYPFLGLSRVLVRVGLYQSAKKALIKAEEGFINNEYWLTDIKERHSFINQIIEIKSRYRRQYITNRKDSSKVIDPTDLVMYKTIFKKVEEKAFVNSKGFSLFLEHKHPGLEKIEAEKNDVIIEVLRRWNSFTPLVVDSRGGGYFIKGPNFGIVIDPGLTFLENFKDNGHKFHEIDSILVSHSHDDHTADLESLINLLYKYNKTLKNNTILARIARSMDKTNASVLKDIKLMEKVEQNYFIEKKLIKLYISRLVADKYCGYFNINKKLCWVDDTKYYNPMACPKHPKGVKNGADCIIIPIGKGDCFGKDCNEPFLEKNKNIKLEAIRAYHEDLGKNLDHSIGFVLDFGEAVIVYTGDTGWEDIKDTYSELNRIYKKNDNKYMVLIAHLGGFKDGEKQYLLKDNAFYDNHLGRLGLVKINETLEPDICIISEFGEEFKGLRAELSSIFNEAFKNRILFIPGDIGLKLNIIKQKVEAISGVDMASKTLYYRDIDPAKIRFVELQEKDCIYYYDKTLRNEIKENYCTQAIMGNFKKVKLSD